MIIRRERAEDRPEILAAVEAAFPEPVEAKLLRELFASREYLPQLSLVAEGDRDEILGHVITTRGWIGETPSLGLGPIAVLPAYQNQGVGSALMKASIAAANTMGESILVLLGSTDYYPRFGFVPADSLGIISPDPSWGSHFMALALDAYAPGTHGRFKYSEPFNAL
ncbi:N-acetyltransferase GCN5 [Arthrobacter sp. PAMC 25486]|uniref:GNAT family N-acetyltransferase n=1 Tax=Arthrobacter sp. PAMC 25486 TaxID=1494608 RepID=UPI000535D609|nr:N-acetyltransferase [Arthrobacter sp. PAMC 25486]AIY03521.1 N-acetyltransferase GCN5 [Arthrobacter sp. PAMC 25486]